MQKLLNEFSAQSESAKFVHISLRVGKSEAEDASLFILLFNFANLCNHNILRRINTTLLGEFCPRSPSLFDSLSLCVLKMSLKRRMGVYRAWSGRGGVGADKSQRLKDSSSSPLPLPISLPLSQSLYILNQRLTMSFPWAMGGARGRAGVKFIDN